MIRSYQLQFRKNASVQSISYKFSCKFITKFIFIFLLGFDLYAQHLGFALDGEVAIGGVGHYPFAPAVSILADYEVITDLSIEARGGFTCFKSHYEGWELGLNSYYNINNWLHLVAGVTYHKNYSQSYNYKGASNAISTDVMLYGFGIDIHLLGICWLETQYYRAFKYKVWTYSAYVLSSWDHIHYNKIKGMYRLGFKFPFEL